MNPAIYVGIFLPLLVLYLNRENRKRKALATVIKKRRSGKEKNLMHEFAVRFVGKECVIYLYDGSQIMGTVKEITEHVCAAMGTEVEVEFVGSSTAAVVNDSQIVGKAENAIKISYTLS